MLLALILLPPEQVSLLLHLHTDVILHKIIFNVVFYISIVLCGQSVLSATFLASSEVNPFSAPMQINKLLE